MSAETVKSTWIPFASFVVAVALALFTGPVGAMTLRAPGDTTSGTCCHEASFKRSAKATVDVVDPGLIIAYNIHVEFQTNGNLLVQASIRNTTIDIPRLGGKVDCELKLTPNADPNLCEHFADMADDIEAHWKFSVPALINQGALLKSQVSLKLKPQVEAIENWDGDQIKEKSEHAGQLKVTPALGLEETKITWGKEGPGVETKINLSLALPQADQDGQPKTILNRKKFKHFAFLKIRHDIVVFDMSFLIGVGNLTGEATTRCAPPTLIDTEEAAWVKFTGPNSLLYKKDCNTPEVNVPLPKPVPEFEAKLKKHIEKNLGK